MVSPLQNISSDNTPRMCTIPEYVPFPVKTIFMATSLIGVHSHLKHTQWQTQPTITTLPLLPLMW